MHTNGRSVSQFRYSRFYRKLDSWSAVVGDPCRSLRKVAGCAGFAKLSDESEAVMGRIMRFPEAWTRIVHGNLDVMSAIPFSPPLWASFFAPSKAKRALGFVSQPPPVIALFQFSSAK